MELMNAKLEKHLRGSVNRRVNCDSANLDKAVDAALEQVEAIERYARSRGLDALPTAPGHGGAAPEPPGAHLSQLAALTRPPGDQVLPQPPSAQG
mgnify:CR=1 FL=1